MNSLFKKPTAWVPIAVSLGMLSVGFLYAATHGIVHETDEGTGAHIFQIGVVVEFFMIAYFVLRWLPTDPKAGIRVLVLQIAALAAVFAAVAFFT